MTHVFEAGGDDTPAVRPGVLAALDAERELAREWMRLACAHAQGVRDWWVIVLPPVGVSA